MRAIVRRRHVRSQPQIAAGIIPQLKEFGINFKLVLADSFYGESESNFIKILSELERALRCCHSE